MAPQRPFARTRRRRQRGPVGAAANGGRITLSSYCAYDYACDDSDFTAGDICCACGGGEGG
eukprot:1524134-Pyramimonas_sp.AAC.1